MNETKDLDLLPLEASSQSNGLNDDLEVEDSDDDSTPIPFKFDITSYGADFPVDALVRRINDGDIVIPTFGEFESADKHIVGFQRNFVWSKSKSDRFIESLLIGLPVPGIFLVRDNDHKLLVLDGQQRLRTLQNFYDRSKKYRLNYVIHEFKGKCYNELDPSDRRRLDDSLIHATVVRQDQSSDGLSSVYDIFERLNTGGMNLNPQEIRVALYNGKFVDLLRELNKNHSWRSLCGVESKRLKDIELILRFFAFYFNSENYARPLKNFLNNFIEENRDLQLHSKEKLETLFIETVTTLDKYVGKGAFRPERVLNASAMDSVMTAMAKRIQRGSITNEAEIKKQIHQLFNNDEYQSTIKTGTSDEEKVRKRLHLAYEAFSHIE